MNSEDVVALALKLPETDEGLSYGTPGVKRKKRFMFRLKEDGESITIKLDWLSHDRMIREHPDICYKTAHYEGYPAFLVKLQFLSNELASELVELSWHDAPKPAHTAKD